MYSSRKRVVRLVLSDLDISRKVCQIYNIYIYIYIYEYTYIYMYIYTVPPLAGLLSLLYFFIDTLNFHSIIFHYLNH
jgi:hypothetical protein